MKDSKLVSVLSKLSSSKLENLYISIPNEIISMDLEKNIETHDNFKVTFEEVSSFYFINEENKIVDKLPTNNSQLNSIGYYANGIGEFIYLNVEKDEITDEDISYPNFALEMINSTIFIEAKAIKINDKKFKVGYPAI